jgi:hypothetical protein
MTSMKYNTKWWQHHLQLLRGSVPGLPSQSSSCTSSSFYKLLPSPYTRPGLEDFQLGKGYYLTHQSYTLCAGWGTLPDFCCVAHLLMVHTLTFRHPTYNTLFHGLISTDRMQRVPDKLIVPYKTVWVVRTWTRGGWGVRVQRQVWLHGGNKNKQTNLETVKVKKWPKLVFFRAKYLIL